MDAIRIEGGKISGMVIGESGKEVYAYRGIPFAAPPEGDLRWKPPQPVIPWEGIKECTTYSNIAPQNPGMGGGPDIPKSDDCLYLNIVSPTDNPEDKLPVMVWLHGGGYFSGSGNVQIYNEPRLPRQGVVLVSVNHRLNVIGLMAHPLLSKESEKGVSGNYMFLDIIASLKWVKKNIAAFGGDPDNVTIFGESGGGAKVACMMATSLAKGLFHRAICESGTSVGTFSPSVTLKEIEANGEKVFAKLGVDKEADPLKAARALPWQDILAAEQEVINELNIAGPGGGLWDAAVDGWFLEARPIEVFESGNHNAVPLITCNNMGELTGPGAILLPWLVPACVRLLTSNDKMGIDSYGCIFDQVPEGWRKEGCVAHHAIEIPYVFGDWDNSSDFWNYIFFLAKPAGAKSPENPGLTEADRKVSEEMMARWAQFAKTGNPNVEGLAEWPAYKPDTDRYLYITASSEGKSGFSKVA
ncbi:carboxylesterase/lipase family protein [Chloroflexota bacterium]